MSSFENVTVVKNANVYFGGNVVSRTVQFPDGTKKTLGFMQKGEYEFGTDAPELMEILSGELQVQLPESSEWKKVVGGESFHVSGNGRFTMKVTQPTDYCCSFIRETI